MSTPRAQRKARKAAARRRGQYLRHVSPGDLSPACREAIERNRMTRLIKSELRLAHWDQRNAERKGGAK